MSATVDLYGVLAFFGVSGCIYAITELLRRSEDRVARRIEEATHARSAVDAQRSSFRQRLTQILGVLLPDQALQVVIGDSGKRSRLQSRLIQAGLFGSGFVSLFATARILLTLAPVGAAVALGVSNVVEPATALWVGAAAGGIGMMLPSFYLDHLRERRHLEFMRSLPDFLDLLIACLSSGVSLESAMQRVTQELKYAHPMLAREMMRVQQEIGLGTTPDAALRNLAERNDLNSLRSLAALCQQARQFGTKVTDALRAHADMLRMQREQRAEERAQKAAVKILFPTLLFIFPAVFVVLAGPAAIQIWQNLGSQ